MASPIFISKPSESFSIWVVLRGIQLATLSTYRSLQNPGILYHSVYFPFIARTIKLSFVFYVVLNVPLYITKTLVFCGNYLNVTNLNSRLVLSSLTHFLQTFLNLNIFLITFANFFDPNSDQLFLANLKFSDHINSTNYYANLNNLPDKSILSNPISRSDSSSPLTFAEKLKLLRSCVHFKAFLKRYANYYLFNIVVFSLSAYENRISTIILCFISFQTFLDKLGSIPSLVLITILNFLPSYYTGTILTTFYGSSNLAQDLLLPYFHRIDFSKFERNQWLKSRDGILFGFGLFNFWLIKRFPQFSVLSYALAQLNMGYLITKLTDEPPTSTNQLFNWTSTQLVWKKRFSVVEGDFIKDPYIGVPGSFMLDEE